MGNTLVSLKDIFLKYEDTLVLDGISLDIKENEIVTIIGPNGAGKTSLIKVLLGLCKANSGSIVLSSNLVIGYVPQKFHIEKTLPISVKSFLQLNNNIDNSEILSVLEEVGVKHIVNSSLQKISGGQLQRVLLARALLRSPNLLVLDEPMQGVDLLGQQELYSLLSKIKHNHNCGVLLVSHDLTFVMANTDIVVCLHKHICCSGRPEEVGEDLKFKQLFQGHTDNIGIYTHSHNHSHDVTGDYCKGVKTND